MYGRVKQYARLQIIPHIAFWKLVRHIHSKSNYKYNFHNITISLKLCTYKFVTGLPLIGGYYNFS